MPSSTASAPSNSSEQALLNTVKAAHETLLVARKIKTAEIERRLGEARLQAQRDWDETEARIRLEVDREIAQHEAAEDAAIIAAYNEGLTVIQIAQLGFGNRLPGAVATKLRELRAQGMIGNVSGYQVRDEDKRERVVKFPEPIDVSAVLSEVTEVKAPTFEEIDPISLVPGDSEFDVAAVRLTMDPRDPYFKQISKNARPGTPHRYATYCTLYMHPGTGALTVLESDESGDVYWDHPVARWVKDHKAEAEAGYATATNEL